MHMIEFNLQTQMQLSLTTLQEVIYLYIFVYINVCTKKHDYTEDPSIIYLNRSNTSTMDIWTNVNVN